MVLKIYNPTSPGTRGMTRINYRKMLSGPKPTKSLTRGYSSSVGRNNQGRITVRHKGGGHKRNYKMIDFKYDKKNIPARIASIEYDPFRSAFVGLAVYADGEKRYVVL